MRLVRDADRGFVLDKRFLDTAFFRAPDFLRTLDRRALGRCGETALRILRRGQMPTITSNLDTRRSRPAVRSPPTGNALVGVLYEVLPADFVFVRAARDDAPDIRLPFARAGLVRPRRARFTDRRPLLVQTFIVVTRNRSARVGPVRRFCLLRPNLDLE